MHNTNNHSTIIDNIQDRKKVMELTNYIDRCLIDEFADKNLDEGHSLDIDSIPHSEQLNFLARLFEADTGLRDQALVYMQKMIDERLPEVTINDRLDQDYCDIYQMRYA